ncbi:MAG: hypothetical protein CM15mP120_05720 [Pseudomonadota bacterium]|nr:MAG: hypothetical protein CM15mP120_05720 [Pseudomonadota bacterium]
MPQGQCSNSAQAQQRTLECGSTKTAQGGAEDLFIVQVTNLARCLTWLRDQGVWLLGADGEGEHLWHAMDTNVPLGLVMGSEGKGLRRLTRSLCDQLISIPMLGRVESLNVASPRAYCCSK